MCGIAGSLSWNQTDRPEHVQSMTDALTHRGPDASGLIEHGAAILGHRRLSIIDLDPSSNQPLWDNTRSYCITYNGELYNYLELKQILQAKGARFRTNSDTEVILEAYKHWGDECLRFFVGMYAFAIWDHEEQTLFIARDRMGEKPLFYAPLHGNDIGLGIVFASELKALLKHPNITKDLNPQALKQFLALNYVLTDSCIYKNIYKLPPAHYMLLKRARPPLIKCYWNLAEHFQNKSTDTEAQSIEKFQALFEQSIKGQMISNVPLGAFLSGGIDSSAVTSFMNTPDQPTKTFSIGFDEDSYSELKQSSLVANQIQTEHHTQVIKGDLADRIGDIIQITDEPFADNSIIPTYFLCEFARSQLTVSLSGDGGDELFGGYETYRADQLYKQMQGVPRPLLQAASLAAKILPTSFNKVSFDYKLKQFLQGCQLPFEEAHMHWRRIFSGQEMTHLLQDDALNNWSPMDSVQPFFEEVKSCHPLDQAMYVDMKTWMVDDILVKVDRASMAHSLEVRAPFLDHRLVAFAASLPVEQKIKGKEKKYLLKKALESRLPKSILYQKKKGFNAPLSHWLNQDLFEMAYETTTSKSLEGIIDLDYVKTLWNDHRRKKTDNGFKLFGLLALGTWAKNR